MRLDVDTVLYGRVGSPLTKDTLNSGHLSNEDSAYCPSYIEMCAKLSLKLGHLSNQATPDPYQTVPKVFRK